MGETDCLWHGSPSQAWNRPPRFEIEQHPLYRRHGSADLRLWSVAIHAKHDREVQNGRHMALDGPRDCQREKDQYDVRRFLFFHGGLGTDGTQSTFPPRGRSRGIDAHSQGGTTAVHEQLA